MKRYIMITNPHDFVSIFCLTDMCKRDIEDTISDIESDTSNSNIEKLINSAVWNSEEDYLGMEIFERSITETYYIYV